MVRPVTLLLCGLLTLGACGERVSSHGHAIDAFELEQIELGESTRQDILLTLGKPSFEGAFQSGKIYYVAQNMRQPAGGAKTTTTRELFIFTFDDKDILQIIEIKDESKGLPIATLDAKTPTPGNTFGVIEQIFANIRRRNENE